MVAKKKLTKSCPPTPCGLEHVRCRRIRIFCTWVVHTIQAMPQKWGFWGSPALGSLVESLPARASESCNPFSEEMPTRNLDNQFIDILIRYQSFLPSTFTFQYYILYKFSKKKPKDRAWAGVSHYFCHSFLRVKY